MAVSGLVFGFTKGWALALCILGLTPVLFLLVGLFGKVINNGLT